MKTTILLLSSLLFFYSNQQNLDPRPVRIFHGLGDDCLNHDYQNENENFKCIETGAGGKSYTKSIKAQALKGCKQLKNEIKTLMPSFYVIGFSQGGLIARWIQLHCEGVGPLIKRMVLVGTPNLGMKKLPSSDSFQEKVYSLNEVKSIIYSNKEYLKSFDEINRKEKIEHLFKKATPTNKPFSKSLFDAGVKLAGWIKPILKPLNLGPMNYLNSKLSYSPLILNLSEKSKTGSLNTLDFLVVIANRDERVVSPPESVTFGMKILDEKGNTIPKPNTSNFIKSRSMFKDLWQKKKLITCLSNSSHSQLEPSEYFWITNILFSEDEKATNYKSSSDIIKDDFLKWYPNYCTFNNPDEKLPEGVFNETTNGQTGKSSIEFLLNKLII